MLKPFTYVWACQKIFNPTRTMKDECDGGGALPQQEEERSHAGRLSQLGSA